MHNDAFAIKDGNIIDIILELEQFLCGWNMKREILNWENYNYIGYKDTKK